MAIEITKNAAKEIISLRSTKNIPEDYHLRITTMGGTGCAGVKLKLGFDKKKDDDLQYLIHNIKVVVKKAELMFIIGQQLNFIENHEERGFYFEAIEKERDTHVSRMSC